MFQYLSLISFIVLLASCSSAPKLSDSRLPSSTQSKKVTLEFNQVYKLSQDLKRQRRFFEGKLVTKKKLIPKGSQVYFSSKFGFKRMKEFHNLIPVILVGGSHDPENTDEVSYQAWENCDFWISADELPLFTRTDKTVETPKTWQEYIGSSKKPFFFLEAIESSWSNNLHESGSRQLRMAASNVSFFFSPDFEKCHNDEVPLIVSDKKIFKETEEMNPSFDFVGDKDRNTLFCLSRRTLKDRFKSQAFDSFPSEETRNSKLQNWNVHTFKAFNERLHQKSSTEILPFLNFSLSKVEGGETYQVNFRGPLIGSCSGQCRLQGVQFVLDFSGKLIDVTQPSRNQSLYYWDFKNDFPFEKGDLERLREYGNDRERLKIIYEQTVKRRLSTNPSFVAKMSQLYTEEQGYHYQDRQAGSAMITFFILLSQARTELADLLNTNIEWPTYQTPYNFE